ncbi:glycyl-radical enzyme activating protein [Corallincola platygyrae]|uniref:Glycyl-radical enzyme activating protein n=1 Tax=Corallincola platygyrae TaxID=1193278 RepID=A0ABW4XNL7_9GAMM
MFFNIQRFSTHDGDGIRTLLFLKGCSLACPWCQNPESRSHKHSLLFDQRSCLDDCDLCVQMCPAITRTDKGLTIHRQAITEQQLIALEKVCPTQALTVCGEQAEADALFEQLMKDKAFYDQSNGGVTFSGGEPLMQPALVADLAQRLQQVGVSTAIETCLHVPWDNIAKVAPFIDCWLLDLKHTDDDKFLQWAKGSLKRIKKNLRQLSGIAKRIVIRVPVVPGFNDTQQELQSILDFAAGLNPSGDSNANENCRELHLLPYHTLGINKYRLLDMPYFCSDKPLNNPELLQWAQAYASEQTPLNVIVRG